jgi:hypothetical protein
MAADRSALFGVPAAAALLLWPAVWNGFPIVFADTGTYLSQAINHYAGWDRPVFYSLFMLPLHGSVTVWPVVVAQALLAASVLWLVVLALVPDVSWVAFVAGVGVLSGCTWLPWLVSELMPDLFTPLLVLALCLLALVPERLSLAGRMALVGLAAFLIATQLSSLPLSGALGFGLLGFVYLGHSGGDGWTRKRVRPPRWMLIILPPALAAFGLCAANLAANGRFAVSPFGGVFLLARVVADGPGRAVLQQECPEAHWRLCAFVDSLPATSDEFLWTAESPLYRAGGPKVLAEETISIVKAAVRADPAGEARAALGNTLEQMIRFDSGDGLEPWPDQVSPWIVRDFPRREQAAYSAARQQTGSLQVPVLLLWVHRIIAVGGVTACLALLPVALRRHAVCSGFLLAVLVVLPVSAAITGALSAPHDRYQARIMWLPAFMAATSAASLRRRPG